MLLHIIVFGVLLFECAVFAVQSLIFRRKEYLQFAFFCGAIALYMFFNQQELFGTSHYLADYYPFIFYLKGQLGLLGFLMYVQFGRNFIDIKNVYPHLIPSFQKLEKWIVANLIFQTIITIFFEEKNIQSLSYTICFILLALLVFRIGIQIIKKHTVLSNFVVLGSFSVLLCSILELTFRFKFHQILFDIGILIDILLLNIGLIYKYNFLLQEEVETQNQIIRDLSEKERLAQKLLAIRQQISHDVHEDVMGGLSSIRISSDLIQQNPTTPSKHLSQKISHTTKDIIQRLHIIIWSLNEDNDDVLNFIAYLKEFGQNYLKDQPIEFRLENKISSVKLIPFAGEQRKTLFFILKELLDTLVLEPLISFIQIELTLDKETIIITVHTDIPVLELTSDLQQKHQKMRHRITKIGGTMNFYTKNSTYHLKAPLSAS